MWRTGLVAPWHVGSSRTRARTHVPCIGRRILNHCTTREAPEVEFLSQRICIFYILTYIVKLYIEKLYKYNPINSIWRYLFFFALASPIHRWTGPSGCQVLTSPMRSRGEDGRFLPPLSLEKGESPPPEYPVCSRCPIHTGPTLLPYPWPPGPGSAFPAVWFLRTLLPLAVKRYLSLASVCVCSSSVGSPQMLGREELTLEPGEEAGSAAPV